MATARRTGTERGGVTGRLPLTTLSARVRVSQPNPDAVVRFAADSSVRRRTVFLSEIARRKRFGSLRGDEFRFRAYRSLARDQRIPDGIDTGRIDDLFRAKRIAAGEHRCTWRAPKARFSLTPAVSEVARRYDGHR